MRYYVLQSSLCAPIVWAWIYMIHYTPISKELQHFEKITHVNKITIAFEKVTHKINEFQMFYIILILNVSTYLDAFRKIASFASIYS